jgi:hypothetical protein
VLGLHPYRDALVAVFDVDTGVLRGNIRTTLYRHELANLHALLQALLDHSGQHLKTSFALIERGVEFEFELLRRGAANRQITPRTDAAGIQHLDFELEIDPSQLQEIFLVILAW